ncbi:MAG: hypothetical protein Q9227_004893 [Pyrenula ochraceoflavens]
MATADYVRSAKVVNGDPALAPPAIEPGQGRSGIQIPIAVVGLACRLPGHNNTPTELWRFLRRGEHAGLNPPPSRFNPKGHYNGSSNGRTMVMPGGMFLEDIDIRDIDSQFFKLSNHEALCMDPQTRQLLEVVFEGLENAGISLDALRGQSYGCFVGSYACDYGDIQNRDPEDRASAYAVGVGRAMLSNRISHFLDLKGPRYDASRVENLDVAGAVVGGCNLYLNPEHAMDAFAINGAGSPTGLCHAFDAKADGYIKSEAVNMVLLKRLDDAIRDHDPIRAVIRGSATTSDGWTAGIASPNAKAQAEAIRKAYTSAGLTDFSATSYIECHGTGTKAGDVVEIEGLASVFSNVLSADHPLRIGSIKSNIGHSEPAAGISGLIKTILALETGEIPGNPTFLIPNPKIDFERLKLKCSNKLTPWPQVAFKRAGVSSFGYGGSNAHVIVDEASYALRNKALRHISSYADEAALDFFDEEEINERLHVLVFSANGQQSLRGYCESLDRHLSNPAVKVRLRDLSYTLSERRTLQYHRAFLVTNECSVKQSSLIFGKARPNMRCGLVFTGQGAQWPEMGRDLLHHFPLARQTVRNLDKVLQSLPDGPKWSAYDELVSPRTADHFRLPEFSQPLTTILQIAILTVLKSWDVKWVSVVGHSSGEIAGAVASGLITAEDAVKIAYYRGLRYSPANRTRALGMLAVGIGAESAAKYITSEHEVDIACYNSPTSVTLSGDRLHLEDLQTMIQNDGHFARMLHVDLAYHSRFMTPAASHYSSLLEKNCAIPDYEPTSSPVSMFSSVTGEKLNSRCNAKYWVENMTSPVLFTQAVIAMLADQNSPDLLIEIGPHKALAGPLSQIKHAFEDHTNAFEYLAAYERNTPRALFDLAGRLFITGCPISLAAVNLDNESESPRVLIDLPNYCWNHSTKFWKENESSKDWRFRKFIQHDLLGSKILGVPWTSPVWKKSLGVEHAPWLKDHKLGSNIVFPAAGYIAMAVEAIFQKVVSTGYIEDQESHTQVSYRIRDVSFYSALMLEASASEQRITLALYATAGEDSWHEFKVSSWVEGVTTEHCRGFVRVVKHVNEGILAVTLAPLKFPSPASLWYKAMQEVGYSFGPTFRRQVEIEAAAGSRRNRVRLDLKPPDSRTIESTYPLHPAVLDSCFQSGAASLWQGVRSSVNVVLVPAHIDSLTIYPQKNAPAEGIASCSAEYVGFGNQRDPQNYSTNVSVHDADTTAPVMDMVGLHYSKLETQTSSQDPSRYTTLEWLPDISLLSRDRALQALDSPRTSPLLNHNGVGKNQIKSLLDLILHKVYSPEIAEFDLLDSSRANSVWLDFCGNRRSEFRSLEACYATNQSFLDAQARYQGYQNVKFTTIDSEPITSEGRRSKYDVVIVSAPSHPAATLPCILRDIRKTLRAGGYFVLLLHEALCDGFTLVCNEVARESLAEFFDASFENVLRLDEFETEDDRVSTYIGSGVTSERIPKSSEQAVHFAHFETPTAQSCAIIRGIKNWAVNSVEHSPPFTSIPPKSTVVVLSELDKVILANMTKAHWDDLQYLVSQECRIFWITSGAQMDVTHPDTAMISGLFRTIRNENPSQTFITLDLDPKSSTDSATGSILQLTQRFRAKSLHVENDSEFVERGGVLHVSRIRRDDNLHNSPSPVDAEKSPIRSLHEQTSCVRLMSDRPGTLDSLHYAEVSTEKISLEPDFAEIQMHAASMNFKDFATVMGLVPADINLLGLDGAGVIARLHESYTGQLRIGQRVLVTRKGCFANLVQTPVDGLYPLPDWMTFEDAATLPSVYRVCVHGLLDLANLQKGKTILIHSGAGGVGIAAIQICQHYGLEIYTTVGADEKRKFLTETFGIPDNHIFSSRSTAFASQLMQATHGRGVDVVLNSLSGDVLDESWRCIAQNGNFIEIGKKDLVNKSSLSMEPFCRNASYRAIDMSLDNIPWPETQKLLARIFKMIEDGIIKPIWPRKIYSFGKIFDAFRDMRSGNHIGKFLISDGMDRSCQVPIRPAARELKLNPDASYLLVGGLRGLCGSIALFLAQHGARHFISLSRSAQTDEATQCVVFNLKALGAECVLAKGDVSIMQNVKQVFESLQRPMAGIIHGAMVLRDKTFSSMSAQDWQECVECKVKGAWNLHNAALEFNFDLDFFTLLSSISGVVGNMSQANYAAANTFLDSFAIYRQRLGLRACSIDLGAIEDVGYLSKNTETAQRFNNQVFSPISERSLHKIIHTSLLQQTDQQLSPESCSQLITGLVVPQNLDSPLLRDIRFAPLASTSSASDSHSSATSSGPSHGVAQAFLSLVKNPSTSRPAAVGAAAELINRQLRKLLGLEEPIDAGRPLAGYGIDSLTAVEFRNWARADLGVEVTTLEVVGAKTLTALAEGIVIKLMPRERRED